MLLVFEKLAAFGSLGKMEGEVTEQFARGGPDKPGCDKEFLVVIVAWNGS